MAKKKITRKELLKETDEFMTLSARAALFVRGHLRQFKIIGIVIVAAIILYAGITTYLNYANRKGQSAYNTAYYALMKNMGSGTGQQDLKVPEGLFQEVIDRHGMSKVSPLALPELAFIKFREKRYDEALSLYSDYLKKVPEDSPYRAMAELAVAACYEGKGELEKAVEILGRIASLQDGLFTELAMLGLARVHRLADRPAEAQEVLKTFVEKHPTSPFYPMVKAHLDRYR